jgi:hypothetical protein
MERAILLIAQIVLSCSKGSAMYMGVASQMNEMLHFLFNYYH